VKNQDGADLFLTSFAYDEQNEMEIMLLIVIILVSALSILVCAIENLRLRAADKPSEKRILSLIGDCKQSSNA
jgi:hypothetical protein